MLYKVHFQLRKTSNELNLLGNRKLFIYSCFATKKVQHRNFWCRWIILAVFSATEAVVSIARRIQAWAGIQTLTSVIEVRCSTSWAVRSTRSCLLHGLIISPLMMDIEVHVLLAILATLKKPLKYCDKNSSSLQSASLIDDSHVFRSYVSILLFYQTLPTLTL